MFCPSCRDEFRTGFTRCESCNVDLVDDLAGVEQRPAGDVAATPRALVPMLDYCGFFALDEARQAREQLKTGQIRSDIVIRESGEAHRENSFGEEYWLRVEATKFRFAAPILGFDSADAGAGEEGLACSQCGEVVLAEATHCANCGRRFEAP